MHSGPIVVHTEGDGRNSHVIIFGCGWGILPPFPHFQGMPFVFSLLSEYASMLGAVCGGIARGLGVTMMKSKQAKPTALDFFSGSGLVTEGLKHHFDVVWANDNDAKKNATYSANFPKHNLDSRCIRAVSASEVPTADLAWGSFPCQDLSLAGNLNGFTSGDRSALFWDWLQLIDEMGEDAPPILALENVVGFLVSRGSDDFALAYEALKSLGYLAGAFVVDAVHFVPQSRPRCFLIAIKRGIRFSDCGECGLEARFGAAYFPRSVGQAWSRVNDEEWVWWKLPKLPKRSRDLTSICDFDAPTDTREKKRYLFSMLSDRNRKKLEAAKSTRAPLSGTGYRRIRVEQGKRVQRLELRFDGVAGCLRTPNGGSSRQIVLMVQNGDVKTRLLTVAETRRLMGARETYKLPGTYNDAYRAMGDAVAVPVTRWISRHLLAPLALSLGTRDRPVRSRT